MKTSLHIKTVLLALTLICLPALAEDYYRVHTANRGTAHLASGEIDSVKVVDGSVNFYKADFVYYSAASADVDSITFLQNAVYEMTTLAGTAGSTTSNTGVLNETTFTYLANLTTDADNNVFVFDNGRCLLISESQNQSSIVFPNLDGYGISSPEFAGNKLIMSFSEDGPLCRYLSLDGDDYWKPEIVTVLHPASPEEGTNFSFSWGSNAAYNPVDGAIYILSYNGQIIKVDLVTKIGSKVAQATANLAGYITFHPVIPNLLYIGYQGVKGGGIYTCDVSTGEVTLYAGANGNTTHKDGPCLDARFAGITGMSFDNDGSLLIPERWGECIRKISPDGMVSTLNINGGNSDYFGGAEPLFITVDKGGNIYVTDSSSKLLRKITLKEK
jgi:hypothetical protein